MIDTDKYEGHTKGGWYVDDAPDVIHPTVIHENQCDAMVAELVAITGEWTEEDYANARLIADAPLLLEEVKRLRERVKTEKNLKLWEKAEVKRLRSIADDLYAYIVSDADISLKIIEEQMDWRDEE